jgi:hypothetical protein
LRSHLAPGLGLLDTSRMINLIEQQKYVLTPDFALKLLILNERRKTQQNVILSGATGVGKVFDKSNNQSNYFFRQSY